MTSGLPSALPRHRSFVTVSGAYVCTYGHKLSLTAALSLTPTPPAAPTVSARYRSAVNPMPPLAIPSRRCRSASFLPPIARMPYCQPRSSHPQRKKPPTLQAPGISIFFVCDAGPNPRPRCAVRRCTDSTSAVGQPLHSLRVCLRLRARAGRLTVCGASSSTESLSLRTSATPAVCANPM